MYPRLVLYIHTRAVCVVVRSPLAPGRTQRRQMLLLLLLLHVVGRPLIKIRVVNENCMHTRGKGRAHNAPRQVGDDTTTDGNTRRTRLGSERGGNQNAATEEIDAVESS